MNRTHYTKTCTLPEDLIPLLKARGLSFKDESKAKGYLTSIGYFRLSAYLRPLYKEPKDKHIFKPDASFEKAMSMYRLDRKLRILLFNEIEKIEVAIRSAMSNIMSSELDDVFWMTDPSNFSNQQHFLDGMVIIDAELKKTKEEFILHFKNTYSDPYPPAWMIAEILPLGVLSRIYYNIKQPKLKKKIAQQFGLNIPVLCSWIRALSSLRNLCCHHGRIWNREIAISPTGPRHLTSHWIDESKVNSFRLYYRICTIKYLLSSISPNNNLKAKLKDLFDKYPTVDIAAMGFPVDWETEPIWQEED